MKYYLDCEFNGMGGNLISLALVPGLGDRGLYLADPRYRIDEGYAVVGIDPWVRENVLPIIEGEYSPMWAPGWTWRSHIETLLRNDKDVTIVTDWPDDIKYFCELILTGPGTMIEIRPSLKFEMHRVDAYPTTLPGAIPHNAYWDAMALRHKLTGAA